MYFLKLMSLIIPSQTEFEECLRNRSQDSLKSERELYLEILSGELDPLLVEVIMSN